MSNQLISKSPDREHSYYKVVSTFASAFLDPFNWFMIISTFIYAVLTTFAAWFLKQWLWLILLPFLVWFLYHYINAILHRELEIDDRGVRYREANRRLFFNWADIEFITIEPGLGQITFLINGKPNRIHEYGLPKPERVIARQILVEKAKAKEIPLEGDEEPFG